MRAAILRTPKGYLEIEERAIPTPGPGEVLVRVHACGVCHGDLMVRNGELPFVRFPIVPGHEVVGVVESLGSGVTHPKTGTRVGVPWLYSACGHSKHCINGAGSVHTLGGFPSTEPLTLSKNWSTRVQLAAWFS